LRKHPFFHFGKFSLLREMRGWSKVLS